MYRVILKSMAAFAMVFSLSNSAKAVEVYMFKGAGDFSFVNENMHFSRGLNKMADILNKEGIRSEVRRFGAAGEALRLIRKRRPESIAIIGHSMGALASMSIARQLKEEGIRIAYMGLIDIPGPVGVAGDNVEWVENYFSINPVYGKLTNVRTHPKAKNIHVFGYIHNRMDDSPKVQNGMLSAIRQVHKSEQQIDPIAQPDIRMANAGQSRIIQTNQPSVSVQQIQVSNNNANATATGYTGQPRAILFTDILANSSPQGGRVQTNAYIPPVSEVSGYRGNPVPPQGVDQVTTASIHNSQSNGIKHSTSNRVRNLLGKIMRSEGDKSSHSELESR